MVGLALAAGWDGMLSGVSPDHFISLHFLRSAGVAAIRSLAQPHNRSSRLYNTWLDLAWSRRQAVYCPSLESSLPC